MYCTYCGENIEKEANYCPHCGTKIILNSYSPAYSTNNNNENSTKTVSLVLGIIACLFFWLPFLSITLGIISIVLGITYKKETGDKTAGTILGIISLILTTIFIIFFFFVILILNYEHNNYDDFYQIEEKTDPMDNFTTKF